MNGDEPGKGLHIDDDWKTEAAQEKERLAAQERAAGAEGGAGAVPEVGFMDLLNLIAVQAAVGLGGGQGAGGEHIPPNFAHAKYFIDLLDLLGQKTKGNLTPEEKKTLDAITYELRMQYVQITTTGGIPPAATPPPATTPGG